MSYLTFHKLPRAVDKKTDQWEVRGSSGHVLGHIVFWAHWRKYVFGPSEGTIYDPACLREIADFCEQQTRERKA